MSGDWDSLGASFDALQSELRGGVSSGTANRHAQEIDAILSSRNGKAKGSSSAQSDAAVDLASLNAAFDAIGSELTDDAVDRHAWSADKSETIERDFDDVAATMDALEVQDQLLDDDDFGGQHDGDRQRLQDVYRRNIQKLEAEVDKIGRATAEVEKATVSKGYRAPTGATVDSSDSGGLQGAMSSINALLANTATVQTSEAPARNLFTGPDNIPPEKLERLKQSLKQGIAQLLQRFSQIKDAVHATGDLSEAVALTAPLANVREDFQLLARLCERPSTLPKLELATITVYKQSVTRLVLSMKTSLEMADRTVQQATNSTVVVRIARIISSTRKELDGENRDK
jgi:hypothetical protein